MNRGRQSKFNKSYFTSRATKVSSLFILGLIICVVFAGCSKTAHVEVENENVKVYIDERAEFLNVVQYLAAYNYYTSIGKTRPYSGPIIQYLTDIESSFLQYRNHEAVLKINEFLGQRVLADGLMATFIGYFNEDFSINESFLEDHSLELAGWGGADRLRSVSEVLVSFYNEIKFADFYANYKDWLNKYAKDVKTKAVGSGDLDFLINYFNKENVAEIHIIVSPINRIMGGHSVANSDDTVTIVAVMGVPKKINEWKLVLFHELTHGYTGSLTDILKDKGYEILKYAPLFESIDDYNEYRVISEESRVIRAIDEYVAHAVSLRIIDLQVGSKTAKGLASMPKKMGFIYVNDICEKLKEFENNRDKYPSFDDFVPEIIKLFDELSQS